MGFFSDMGFWEKVAFVVTLPVTAPAAVVATAYEEVTGNKVFSDTNSSNTENEQEARQRVERQAKEKRAEEERQAITSYATNGLIALQKMHSSADQPVLASLSFTQLQKAVQGNQQPVEILTYLLPNASGSDSASAAQQKTNLLNDEIRDLQKLRQAIIDMKTSKVNA
ncbi:MAG: hypothetical protein ACWA6Y_12750 [Polaromonas sp.]